VLFGDFMIECIECFFYVGCLDFEIEGLILFINDGELVYCL